MKKALKLTLLIVLGYIVLNAMFACSSLLKSDEEPAGELQVRENVRVEYCVAHPEAVEKAESDVDVAQRDTLEMSEMPVNAAEAESGVQMDGASKGVNMGASDEMVPVLLDAEDVRVSADETLNCENDDVEKEEAAESGSKYIALPDWFIVSKPDMAAVCGEKAEEKYVENIGENAGEDEQSEDNGAQEKPAQARLNVVDYLNNDTPFACVKIKNEFTLYQNPSIAYIPVYTGDETGQSPPGYMPDGRQNVIHRCSFA